MGLIGTVCVLEFFKHFVVSESLDLLWWKMKKLNFQCVLMDFKEYLLLISNSLLKTSIIKVFVKN